MNDFLIILLKHSALMSAAILLLIILSKVLHNKTSPRLRFTCWVVVAFGLLVFARPNLYTMSIPGSVTSAANNLTEQIEIITVPRQPVYPENIIIPQASQQSQKTTEAKELPQANPNEVQNTEAEPVKPTLSFDKILKTAPFIIWCIGAIVFLAVCTVRHMRFMHTIKRWGRPVSDEHLTGLLADVCGVVNLKRDIRLIVCPAITTPVIIGFFRPAIILPDEAIESSKLRFMLIHECIHFKRGDIWTKSLVLLAMAVHWFNPLVYLMNRAIIDEAEHSCDLAVLRCTGTDKRYQYGETILYTAKRSRQAVSVLSSAFGGGKNLKQRLLDVVERTAPKRWVSISCALVLLAGLILTGGLVGCEVKGGGVDAPADFTPTEELVVYVPPGDVWWVKYNIFNFKLAYLSDNINLTIEYFDDEEVYNQRINTELMTGKGPDVIFTSSLSNMDLRKAADSGVFLDINKFIEQDEEFNRADYLEVVMDGGLYRGRQYIVPINYSVYTVLGSTPKLDEFGFDREKTADSTSFLQESVRVLTQSGSDSLRAAFTQSNFAKYNLLPASGIRLVDIENKRTLPDEDAFRAFCEAYKPYFKYDVPPEGDGPNRYFSETSPWDNLQTGAFMFGGEIDINHLTWTATILKTTGGFEVFPLRRADGGIEAMPCTTLAIRATSKNQLNAYKFIKFMLSETTQTEKSLNAWFRIPRLPVLKGGVEIFVNENRKYWETTNSRAGWYADEGCKTTWADPSMYTPLSDDEAKALQDMYLGVTHCDLYGTQIDWIEYMTPYFKDESSYEDCVKRLKSKLKVYISE